MNKHNPKPYLNNENDGLRSAFIDVEELRNVPHKELPSTAHEFLVSVITERINTAEARYTGALEKLNQYQNKFFVEEPLPPVHDKLKPTKEWQNIQVADFSEVRSYISRMRNKKNKFLTKNNVLRVLKDADLNWWRSVVHKHDPNLSTVIEFKAVTIDEGLENLSKLLKEVKPGHTIDRKIGQWIYALLSCLKQPLQSDSISIIRDLARQCWKVRSRIDPESENARELATPLSLLICIVGHYYRQLDLADSLD